MSRGKGKRVAVASSVWDYSGESSLRLQLRGGAGEVASLGQGALSPDLNR